MTENDENSISRLPAESKLETGELAKNRAEVLWAELLRKKSVSRDEFTQLCLDSGYGPKSKDTKDSKDTTAWARSEWSRLSQPICMALTKLGYDAQITDGNTLTLANDLAKTPVEKTLHLEDKKHIGDLVAKFLHNPKWSNLDNTVCLGSGSTIYAVGIAMDKLAKKEPYRQSFSTINIRLAALWSWSPHPPTEKIGLPQGDFEIRNFRFEKLEPNQLKPAAVAIVAADGCHFDSISKKVSFYAKYPSIAHNTNQIVKAATSTVLVCLVSGKKNWRNYGSPIELPPKDAVVRVVVTGRDPLPKKIRDAFEDDDYIMVEKEEDFQKIKDANDKLAGAIDHPDAEESSIKKGGQKSKRI